MRSHSLLWLVLIVFTLLLAPLFVQPKAFQTVIDTELADALRWYSKDEVQRIANRSGAMYETTMVSSGLDPFIRDKMMPKDEFIGFAPGKEISPEAAKWTREFMNYWNSMMLNIYLFFFRLAHSLTWFIYLLPFIAAIIFDGVMTRNAKIASFQYTSPTVYNMSWHAIIFLFASSLAVFTLPIPMTAIFYPIIITLSGMLIRLVIGNIQHSA